MARAVTATTHSLINVSGTNPAPSSLSVCFWVKNPSVGDFFTYIYQDAFGYQVCGDTAGTSRIAFDRGFSTTGGHWFLDSAAHGLTLANWNHMAWTHDGSNVANTPIFYANGVAKTVTLGTTPVGTVRTTASNLYIGTREITSRFITGPMAYVSTHNVILTAGEITQSRQYGLTTRGLTGWWPLYGTAAIEPDHSGNQRGMTVTLTSIANGPPVSPYTFGELGSQPCPV